MNIAVVMVGCGAFARRYHLPAIETDGAARIAMVFDPSPAPETIALAARHGVKLARTLDEVPDANHLKSLADEKVCAIVTTPHTLHADHVARILDLRMHTLVDKPFVMHAKEAIDLAARAEAAGLVNAVAYNRRFDKSCVRARELIREGAIGTPRYVQTVQLGYERAGWFLVPSLGGGGPYTGRASHMADLLPWLLGRQPTRLRSRLRSSSPERSDHGGFIELQFDELECQMTCIEEGWHMWDEVRIFGDDGLIELRRPLTVPIGWSLRCLTQRMTQELTCDADATPGGATIDFFDALRGRGEPACSFAQAVSSVRLVERAFDSARQGGEWLPLAD